MVVICCSCDGEYETIPGSRDQAYGCSADSRICSVVCHYGSKYDGMVFSASPYIEHGIICDECIDEYLANGSIKDSRDWSCSLSTDKPNAEITLTKPNAEITVTYRQIIAIKDFAYKIAQLPDEILVLKQTNTELTISMTKKL